MVFKTLSSKARAAVLAALLLLPAASLAQVDPVEPDESIAEDLVLDELTPEIDAAPSVMAEPADDGARALTKEDVDTWLDGMMPYALEEGGIVGAVVTVVKDGEILTSRGFGYSDLESRASVDGYDTMFRPGSVSKLFTWTAVMQLWEQGKIDLDEDVNTYLDFEIPEAFDAPITMRHLMTHTAGFQEKIKNLILSDPDQLLSLEELMKTETPPSRIFPPGTTPAYSNYGTALAGYIVQRVSGESFEEYVQNHIFDPLGMDHSTFVQPLPEEYEDQMSSGYQNARDGKAQYYELVPMGPAGSLASTGEDMGRFMIAYLNGGGPLMKPETTRIMQETIDQHVPPLNAMALGFLQYTRGDLRAVGHAGDTIFFHSDLALYLDKNVGIYSSVNSSGSGAGTLRFELATRFGERYFPEARVEEEPRLDTAKEHGAEVVGIYESSRAQVTTFVALTRFMGQSKGTMNKDGDLVVGRSTWREIEPYVWRKEGGVERLSVVMTEDGKVERLAQEPFSTVITSLPAPWYRSTALLTPLIMGAVGVLLLTLVMWPVRAVVRWRYKGSFALSGQEAMSHRLVRVGVILVLVQLFFWLFVLQTMQSNLTELNAAFDAKVRIAQVMQVFLYLGLGLALWNVATVWRSGQSWFAKLWSALLPLAIAVLIWFSAIAGLLSFSLAY